MVIVDGNDGVGGIEGGGGAFAAGSAGGGDGGSSVLYNTDVVSATASLSHRVAVVR
jgi:hypothetical protein